MSDIKTKEEIFHESMFDDSSSTPSVIKAMDAYAKQECLSLIEFLQSDERLIEDEWSADKLYEYYLQSKQK